jgi:predicted aconitase with swiveling domain
MSKTFKGRPVIAGAATGTAVVTKAGVNILASFQKDILAKKPVIKSSDQNNPELFGKALTGKILCLPRTIGSTTGGMILQKAIADSLAPKALLFAEPIDSLAAAGVILAKVWNDKDTVTVDGLGPDFLGAVHDGDTVEIRDDGTVVVHDGGVVDDDAPAAKK